MNESLKKDVINLLLEFSGRMKEPAFSDTSWIHDFELDSLATFHFLLHLEKVLQFRFADDDFSLAGIESFDGLVQIVRMRRSQA